MSQQPRAYLLLIIDTRPHPTTMPDWRRLSVGIFGEATPTLAGHCRSVQLSSASGPTYEWCRDQLLGLIDAPEPNGLSWCKPLLAECVR